LPYFSAILDPLVLVAVDTSESFVDPSGKLLVVDRKTRGIVAQYDLTGQPDSVALSPDRKRAAIIIENERDEDLNDGLLPQYPEGALLIVDLYGSPNNWVIRTANLAPVAASAVDGSDLEPEFVDINERNEAVVTFQENNHIAIIDLRTGKTISNFSAGSAQLSNVDTNEDDLITLDSELTRRREPDGVTWIDKGIEPEALEFGKFGRDELLFVGSERSNAVAIYEMERGKPELLQVLPTGIGPEGLKAITQFTFILSRTRARHSPWHGVFSGVLADLVLW
jgi:hypothetical protein